MGTPYCVTVDVKTVGDAEKGEAGDGASTIRERDSMEQIRVPHGRARDVFDRLLGGTAWRRWRRLTRAPRAEPSGALDAEGAAARGAVRAGSPDARRLERVFRVACRGAGDVRAEA